MRVAALHEDVLLVTSAVWQTTCTVVRRGEEAFVVDSPVLPHELEALPALLGQARFPFTGLLVTHADWDHVLGRLAFPGAPLACAETTAARLAAEPGAPQRELRAFDDEHYVGRPRPLALGQVQALPVPGHLAMGGTGAEASAGAEGPPLLDVIEPGAAPSRPAVEEGELELHPADGHTADGMAIFVPWAAVLVCGDYLSPVEIPMLSPGGARDAYLATLRRLEPLVRRATHVVAGHGGAVPRDRALAILEEDAAYLEGLPQGAGPPRRAHGSPAQRAIHEANRAKVGA